MGTGELGDRAEGIQEYKLVDTEQSQGYKVHQTEYG